MPTYTVYAPAGRLSGEQKAAMAAGITRRHNEITGAATFFAQVIVQEVVAGNWFMGGRALGADQVFLNGQIRAGRSAIDRARLLAALRDAVMEASGAAAGSVWVYLTDLPARDMVEYGRVLPEPGGEAAWIEGMPAADRARMVGAS